MSTQNSNKSVTFILIGTEPTTYMKSDGSFVDKPVKRKILMEYSGYAKIDGKKELVKFRHIRNEKEFIQEKQPELASFNPTSDNVYFINGLLIVPESEEVTIKALRAHKDNLANADLYPNQNPVFEEVNPEAQAKKSLDTDKLATKAKSIIYDLYDDENGFKIKDKVQLAILAHIFNCSYDLGDVVKINELKGYATSDPISFLQKIQFEVPKLIELVQSALDKKIITVENSEVNFGDKPLCSLKGIVENQKIRMILFALVGNPTGRGYLEEIKNSLLQNKIQ